MNYNTQGLWDKSLKNVVASGNFFCQWHRWVNFEFEYLGEFEVKEEYAFGSETVTQGKMIDEKQER